MTTTLTYGATVLTLPDDLSWPDEFAWTAVQASRSYSVGGALLFDRGVKLAGRPVTLAGAVNRGWASRLTARTLHAWVQLPAPALALLFRGVAYPSVAFDHTAVPLEVTPLYDYSDPSDSDLCWLTLRLITL